MIFGLPSVAEIAKRIKETFSRFPLAMVASLLVALISIYLIEVEPKKMEGIYLALSKIALTGSLMVFVFTAVQLLGEWLTKKWHFVWVLFALVGAFLYYLVLPESSKAFDASIIPFRHFFLTLLFAVAFLWAPFVQKDPSNSDYWAYAKQILFSWTMAFLFTIVAILGVNGALFAIEKLFDLDIAGKRYFQIDILIIALFSVGYFLSQIPHDPSETRFSGQTPKVEGFFTKWLLTPLSLLYFVILYAYSAKLLVTQEWPKGILAWLIVAFSIVAILTYLFWTHFTQKEHGVWRRWIWLAVLLQTGMLFIAIGMRIAQYSWTESRYMVFVLGVWLAGVSLYFLVFRHAKIKWIFVSLSLLIAITQFGPLSAYSVSEHAQATRLAHMVEALKKYTPASKAPLKLRYEISDSISYLSRRYRRASLKRIFPKIVKAFKKDSGERTHYRKEKKPLPEALDNTPVYLPAYITHKLGFKYINKWEYRQQKKSKTTNADFTISGNHQKRLWHVSGYDYTIVISVYGYQMTDCNNSIIGKKWDFPDQNITFAYTEQFQFRVQKNDTNVSFDLRDHLKKLVQRYGSGTQSVKSEELALEQNKEHLKVKLELNSLGTREIKGRKIIELRGRVYIGESK